MSKSSLSNRVKTSDSEALYDGHDLCPKLSPGQMFFRVKTYNEGVFETVFHEHVPSHRLSQDSATEALRSLVARYSEWPDAFILHSLLNKRGRNPQCYPGFAHHVGYPERGVLRHTVGASNAHAWHDAVVEKGSFRQAEEILPEAKQ